MRKGTYHIGDTSRQSLRCLLTQYMELEEASDKEPQLLPFWVTAHACLKDFKTNNLKFPFIMGPLICFYF